MIELLGNPSLYDGEEVVVTGYSAVGRENQALYLDAAEAQAAIPANALWLDYHILSLMSASMTWPDSLNNAYILVQGTFHARERGHLGVFGGEVEVHRVVRYRGP